MGHNTMVVDLATECVDMATLQTALVANTGI
jgi:hypothetical protein